MRTVNAVERPARGRTPWYWLLAKGRAGGMEVLTEKTAGGEVLLPVFGSEEDARAYVPEEGDWAPRKTGRGELVSVLLGVCRETKWVALDPPPGMTTEEVLGLLGVSREGFLEPLLGRSRLWFEKEITAKKGRVLMRTRRKKWL